jgi:hypothetical protein
VRGKKKDILTFDTPQLAAGRFILIRRWRTLNIHYSIENF